MEFLSKRLSFRTFTFADISQEYIDWLNDAKVNKYLETRHVEQTRQSCEVYVKSTEADPNSHFFAVCERATARHIGNVKIGFINPTYKHGQLSFFIGDKSAWGKGFATEIVGAMTEFGFTQLGLEKIEAGCYQQNLAAVNVFLKNNYAIEGFIRGKVVVDGRRSGVVSLGILRHEMGSPSK